ncbi:MAG: prepilin-type N-terminal cleavage/methylation domain-containing protein [Lachnospiraceae bacterium]|jgi:prepilin-type N-terminal cleavage/methylation domain-containing protein|nr:prepilin-type N-terminal cleavage/methylation domain-containing protein [Lachnospiraceae bacterium]
MKFIKFLQTDENNEGFTLIELIVVIAIAAVMITLIAAYLIRYIERTHVSADCQLANSLRMALITSLGDPMVDGPQKDAFIATYTMSPTITQPVLLSDSSLDPHVPSGDNAFAMSIGESLTFPSNEIVTGMKTFMRSRRNAPEFAVLITSNNVIVVITGTNRNAAYGTPPTGLNDNNIVMGVENATGPYY